MIRESRSSSRIRRFSPGSLGASAMAAWGRPLTGGRTRARPFRLSSLMTAMAWSSGAVDAIMVSRGLPSNCVLTARVVETAVRTRSWMRTKAASRSLKALILAASMEAMTSSVAAPMAGEWSVRTRARRRRSAAFVIAALNSGACRLG